MWSHTNETESRFHNASLDDDRSGCVCFAVSPSATTLANQYLRAIETTASFPTANGGEDFVFVGHSRGQSGGWRVIVVAGHAKPRVAWDSSVLHDPYLNVTGLSFINMEADGSDGYIITLRGCVPHQCADGRMGFAVFTSHHGRAYISHV